MMFDSSQAPWGVERQGPITQGGGSVPQANALDDAPAAGRKTPGVLDRANKDGQEGSTWGQPGSANSPWDASKQNAEQLQRQLSNQLIDKERLEQEFWRIGNKSKTKRDIDKKMELESALE